MFSVHHLIGPTFHQFWDSFSRTLGVMKVGCRPETQSISMGSPAHSLSSVMGQMFNNLGAFQMDEILYFAYGCLPLVQSVANLSGSLWGAFGNATNNYHFWGWFMGTISDDFGDGLWNWAYHITRTTLLPTSLAAAVHPQDPRRHWLGVYPLVIQHTNGNCAIYRRFL